MRHTGNILPYIIYSYLRKIENVLQYLPIGIRTSRNTTSFSLPPLRISKTICYAASTFSSNSVLALQRFLPIFFILGCPKPRRGGEAKWFAHCDFLLFPTFVWPLLESKLLFDIGFFITVPFFSASACANLRLVLASCVGRKTHDEDEGRFSLLVFRTSIF